MTEPLRPGTKGNPLPVGEAVFRLLKASKNGKASETAFILSSEDEAADLQAISVWAEHLTTPEQARNFFSEESRTLYQLAAFLSVDDVRKLRPEPDSPDVPYLDVVWDTRTTESEDGSVMPDTNPGAEGHAGITGLLRPPGLGKMYYRSLRSQLADLANQRLVLVDPP